MAQGLRSAKSSCPGNWEAGTGGFKHDVFIFHILGDVPDSLRSLNYIS